MPKEFDPRNCQVALLAGGKSGEREISLASGVGAKKALETAGFNVTVLDPAKKQDLITLIDGHFDVAFLCMHGEYGEDGTLQGMLELIGLPYTGSGVWASALAMNKVKAKAAFERGGLMTPDSMTVRKNESFDIQGILAKLGSHCVVKPTRAGSALGVCIAEGEMEIEKAIDEAFEIDSAAIIERYVKGTELTVAVVGGENPEALPVIEIVPSHNFYDFESKYAPGGSKHICPANLDERTTKRVQSYALQAHEILECRGMSRSDFIMDEDGTCWILETNTIPGMTETSLLPDAAAAADISFPDLCTKLIKIALRME